MGGCRGPTLVREALGARVYPRKTSAARVLLISLSRAPSCLPRCVLFQTAVPPAPWALGDAPARLSHSCCTGLPRCVPSQAAVFQHQWALAEGVEDARVRFELSTCGHTRASSLGCCFYAAGDACRVVLRELEGTAGVICTSIELSTLVDTPVRLPWAAAAVGLLEGDAAGNAFARGRRRAVLAVILSHSAKVQMHWPGENQLCLVPGGGVSRARRCGWCRPRPGDCSQGTLR